MSRSKSKDLYGVVGSGRARLWVTDTNYRRLSTAAALVRHITGPGLEVTSPRGARSSRARRPDKDACAPVVHILWTTALRSVAMTMVTGPAAEISRTYHAAHAFQIMARYLGARVADLAADDPDAAEAGPLTEAVLYLDMAGVALDSAGAALANACHAAHTSRE